MITVGTEFHRVTVIALKAKKKKKKKKKSSHCGLEVTNLTGTHEDLGSIHCPTQWVKDLALP